MQKMSLFSHKFWRILNNTFGNLTDQTKTLEIIDPVTNELVPLDDCPNYMNRFLVGACPKLANNLKDVPFEQTFRDFFSNFKLNRITVEETIKIIEKIEISKSSAVERLSARVLKMHSLFCPYILLSYLNFQWILA